MPILSYEGEYEVSDLGRSRSVERTVVVERGGSIFERKYRSRYLSPVISNGQGHLAVTLSRKGSYHRALIHHLVLEAFVEPRPPSLFGLHRDDDPANNTLPNLYWGTKRDNQLDKVRNGNHHNTLKTHCPQDHEYTEENTRWVTKKNGDQARRCIICIRRIARESYHRRK